MKPSLDHFKDADGPLDNYVIVGTSGTGKSTSRVRHNLSAEGLAGLCVELRSGDS